MTEYKQQKYDENIEIMNLIGSNYLWADPDVKTCILIREPGCIKVDFYPHTGKWKHTKGRRQIIMTGGADAFIKWYNENKENKEIRK